MRPMPRAPATLSQQVLAATAWNTLMLPARFSVALVASVVYYRALSLEQVGLLFLITSLAATLGLHADLGIEKTLPRFLPEVEHIHGREGVRRLIRQVIRFKLLILVLFVLLLLGLQQPLSRALAQRERAQAAELAARAESSHAAGAALGETATLRAQADAKAEIAAQIEGRGLLVVAVLGALLVCGALYDVHMKVLTAYFRQRAWNLISVIVTLLQPLLVTAFILAGWGVGGVLLALVITPALAVALASAQARRVTGELPAAADTTGPQGSLRARFARYASVSYLSQLATWLTDVEFVVFLAAAWMGLEQVAVLGFAYKFARDFLNYVATPLAGLTTPLLTRVRQRQDPSALREAHASLTRLIWLLVLPAAIGLSLLAERLIATLYPKYLAGAGLVLVFVAGSFGDMLLQVPQQVLMVVERYRAVVLSQLVALLSLPLAALLQPRHGVLGIAIAVTLARLAARVVTLVYAARRLGLRLPLDFGWRVGAASAAFTLVLLPLLRALPPRAAPRAPLELLSGLLPLLGLAALGVVVYLLVLRLLGGLAEADRRRVLELPIPFRATLARLL